MEQNLELISFKTVWGMLFLSFLSYIFYMVGGKNKKLSLISTGIFFLTFLVLTFNLSLRSYSAGRVPFSNLYESLMSFTWGLILIYLIIERKYKINVLGLFASGIAFLAIFYAALLPKEIEPLIPALQSNWLIFHVLCFVFAYGAFALSFGGGIIYLFLRWLRGEKNEKIEKDGGLKLQVIELLIYRIIAFAFPFMTLGIITGAVWADKAWGSYWSWDPKETWSLITWLVYAAFLHARYNNKWKGTVTAVFSIAGFAVVMFTYLGVSFLLAGLHSYAK